jgi:tetratricopeptide (TPR) repeat protein
MQQNTNKSAEELTVCSSGQPTSGVGLMTVLTIAVCAAVLITHWPALSAQAISIDDSMYFVNNFLVRTPSWESVRRFLVEVLEPSSVRGYYQPLTMISLMLDYALGGQTDNLRIFHQMSLLLHVVNTTLIIVLLYQLFGSAWGAAAVGLLFGVHPLTVEPIPWIGERKTLLAAFFTLWSLVLYVRYVHRGSLKNYFGCFAMYVLALMSKPTSTPLPVMLLLMDFWPLRRLNRRAVLEKLPLFVIGGISAIITYISQNRTASIITPQAYGPMRILFIICHDVIFYLYKMIWPVNLTSHYPFPVPLGFANPMVIIGVIGTGILIVLLVVSLRWTRAALTGWLIFFIMVFPTLQTFQFSDAIASDKYIYLPLIGLLMILTAFLGWVCGTGGLRQHTAKYVAVAIIVLILAGAESLATRRYLADWKDSVSLYARMARISPNSIYANNNLGAALGEKGDIKQAIEYFNRTLEIDSNDIDARMNLGKILADQGEYDKAMSHYNETMRLSPAESDIYNHIALILIAQNRIYEAIAVYREGLERKTMNPAILHTGLGTLLFQQGKIDEAMDELQVAVKLKPDATAFNNLGMALTLKGRIDEAMKCHKKAVQLDPKNAEAHYDLGNNLLAKGRFEQAIGEYEKALQINPRYAKAHGNLAVALAQQGRLDEAIKHFAGASKIEPNNIGARHNLAMALINKGLFEDAVNQYREILKLQPQDVDTRCVLGDVLARQGRFDKAAAEYRQVLKINPNYSRAQEGLKNISAQQQPGQTSK